MLTSFVGHVDIIKVLLEHGADANACDINDWTPLHDAARSSIHQDDNKERAECIEILVKKGEANINALNIRRETPLHIACEFGSKKLIKRLRKLGVDLFATTVNGYNCLEVAIEQGNEEVVLYLIKDDNCFDLMRNSQIQEKSTSRRFLVGRQSKVDRPMRNAQTDEKSTSRCFLIGRQCKVYRPVRNAQSDEKSTSRCFPVSRQCKVDTPMRKLIREMPKMALLMLNKCSMTVGSSGTNVHKNIFVYEFLEDQYTVKDWAEGKPFLSLSMF